ncbi:Zinc finger protein-like 1-like protein [Armadillidium vulgare]|nr:Zinc finger protein-like 1-like protein [Armadillidium vulgare]
MPCLFLFNIPASNLVSPVADALREILLKSSAKYSGHGNKSEDSSLLVGTHNNLQNDRGIPDGRDTTTAVPLLTEQYQNSHHQSSSSQHRSSTLAASGKTRKVSDASSIYINNEEDTGENKYKRRPALEWFNRWLRTFHRPSSRHHQALLGGRRRMTILLIIIAVCTVIALLSYLGRSASNEDPMLDPFNNPNIRIEENI